MLKRILGIICIIEMILILILVRGRSTQQDELKRTKIVESISDDGKYRVVINEIGMAPPLGDASVEVYVGHKVQDEWRGRIFIQFDIANEGSISKDNFSLEWFDEGVIIHIKDKLSNYAYRLYWSDLFEDN